MLKWTVTKRPEGGTAAAAAPVQRQRQLGASNLLQRPQHARRSLGALNERNIYSDNITAASKVKARRSLGATMHRHATSNVDKENQCVTSTPHPAIGNRTSASPYSMALRDVSNITPNSTPRRLSSTPQGRKRALPVSPTAAITSTAKKESNLPYASTLPTFDIEYSPCGVKNVPFLALRGLGLTDSYFETPGRYFQEDQKPPAAKRPKPFVAPAPPADKSEPSLTPLSSRLSELRFSKISFKRHAEPKTVNNNNNKIFNDDEPSLNSSEMGDITLDKMIDAILESAKKDKLATTTVPTATTATSRPKRSSSQKSKQPKIPSPTYTAADDPASDLYPPTDILLRDQLPPKLIEHAETTIILEETTHVNEREVKTPEPIATKSQAKSLRQSLTRFVLASPLDACNLRRQKAVRRKNKHDPVLIEKEPAEKKPCRIGLTLPNGIPSPETPKTASYNQSKLEQLAQMQTPTEIAIVVDLDPPNTASKSSQQLKLSTIEEMTPSMRSVDLQGTSTPTGGETLSLEKTRKCLAFSPTLGEDSLEKRYSVASSTTSRCSRVTIVKGSLDVQMQVEEGQSDSKLHVHVIRCKDLQRLGGNTINVYVKVAVVNPANPEKDQGFQRTAVHRNSSRPLFDHRFVFELGPNEATNEEDLRRVQIAVWHRDRECKRSEFLGCMSFPLKNVFKQEINGSFKLQPQSCLANPTPPVPDSAENSHCSVDVSVEENTASTAATTGTSSNISEPSSLSKKVLHQRDADENLFLRMLEIDPPLENRPYPGRTPFTITKQLNRIADKGFGFSIVWTHPPRVEKVEPELSADQAGILPGDYVVFVGNHNVVTMPELDVLNLIKLQGDSLPLEIYRRPLRPVIGPPSFTPYIVPTHPPDILHSNPQEDEPLPKPPVTPIRLSTACSNTILTETAKRRLNLPQVTFTKEVGKGVLV